MNVRRKTAYMVLSTLMVKNFASLFICTALSQAIDRMRSSLWFSFALVYGSNCAFYFVSLQFCALQRRFTDEDPTD